MLFQKTGNKKRVIFKKVVFHNNIFSQGWGLMLHRKITNEAHIFRFDREIKIPLTMWLVFFPIDVIYLDKKGNIVELVEGFKPFTNYNPKNNACTVIELPVGSIKKKGLKKGIMIKISE